MAAKASAGKFYEGLGGQEGGNNAVEKVKAFQAKLNQQLQVLLDKSTPKPLERWLLLAAIVLIYFIRTFLLRGFYIVTYALGIYNLNLLIGFISPQIDPETEGDGPQLPTKSDQEFKPFVRRLPEFKFWYVTAEKHHHKLLAPNLTPHCCSHSCSLHHCPALPYAALLSPAPADERSPLSFINPSFDSRPRGFHPSRSFHPAQNCFQTFRRAAMKSVLIGFTMTFFPMFDLPVFWPVLLLYWIMLFTVTMKKQIKHMIKHKYVPFSFGKKKYNTGAAKK
mmetsp:Transcript_12734/g.32976  ORF Transcript_12734/g.32976 Transcript_12734/m.32976 type:complete len:279 (-) Transcript_12734:53-889(-)